MPGKNRDSLEPVRWKSGVLEAIDQTRLPGRLVYVRMRTVDQVCSAIRSMKVRGAPLIGVAGGYGLVLAALKIRDGDLSQARSQLRKSADSLISTRPTGVNLRWAVERVFKASFQVDSVASLGDELRREADAILREELEAAHNIGRFGAGLIEDGDTVLTHCNAGALATAGFGTALAVVRAAIDAGKRIQVIACETRPFLQGARLTAWELKKDRIPVTLITDNMAGHLMQRERVSCVIVGTDRTAANGDVANKIGTYPLAVLAHRHAIPFYVAAPISSIDFACPNGDKIPIVERPVREVTHVLGRQIAPSGIRVLNPAFDVTPNELVTAIVTERGIARQPLGRTLPRLVEGGPAAKPERK